MHYAPRWLVILFAPLLLWGCESSLDAPETPATLPEQAQTATALLPHDARMVAMVDLQQMRTNGPTPLRDAFSKISNPSLSDSGALQDFLAESGLDVSRDVERVYLTHSENEGTAPHLVLTGSFDRDRIGEALKSQAGRDFQTVDVARTPVFSFASDGNSSEVALAVLRNDLMVIAPSVQDVETMMSRSRNGTAPDDALLRSAAQGQSAWYVLRDIDGPSDNDAPDRMEQLGAALQDMAGGFTFTDDGALDGVLTLIPRSDANPSDVADVVRGLIAAAKQSSDIDGDARRALDRTEVRVDGETVTVTAYLPASLVERLAERNR